MPAKPNRPRSPSPADAGTVARHRAAPLAGLFGDPDGCLPHRDRADGDPVDGPADWTALFALPRERRPQ